MNLGVSCFFFYFLPPVVIKDSLVVAYVSAVLNLTKWNR